MTDNEQHEQFRRLFGTGRTDQLQAAVTDAWRSTARLAAERGARRREVMEDQMPPLIQDLMDYYRHACHEARRRYEDAIPEGERVPGRLRWINCQHITGQPQPVHWYSIWPDMLVCERCAPTEFVCYRCGRQDDRVTVVTLADQHSAALVHAMFCDDCYPEGADAPAAR